MKKLSFASIMMFVLAGCASTQAVLDKAPTEVYYSPSSANEVAFCLANKNNTSSLDRDDGSKVVLIKNGYGGVSMAFAVFPEPNGSRVEYRKQFGTVGGIWKQCINPADPDNLSTTPVV